jgi:hypothetical protein
MSKLKSITPAARHRGAPFNREINASLARSRAFGSSVRARFWALVAAFKAALADPKSEPRYVPQPSRTFRRIAPGVFGKVKRVNPRVPAKAEIETLIASSDKRFYARLTNGQIVRRRAETVNHSWVFWLPAEVVTLNQAGIAAYPQIAMARG